MKVLIHAQTYGGGGNRRAFDAFLRGVRRCGDTCSWTDDIEEPCDVAVHPSGPKAGRMARHRLSVARAHLIEAYPDRRIVIESPAFRHGAQRLAAAGTRYWRVAWNGFLRGEADYMNDGSPPDRWNRIQAEHGIELASPDDRPRDGEVMVMLQKTTDASVRDIEIGKWANDTARRIGSLTRQKINIRNHPLEGNRGLEPLEDALERAAAVVTYTSLSSIEAICAGRPVWADEKSLAWPVANRSLESLVDPWYPDEAQLLQWLSDLAYTQWTEDELSSGAVWERYRARIL